MKHEIYKVTSFLVQGPFVLRVSFDDGTSQVIDFEPVLRGEMFGPLKNKRKFSRVRIDPEVHTLVWPNGADFDPATLHDWPLHARELAERARGWYAVASERQVRPTKKLAAEPRARYGSKR
jgi:hypothetical protein